MAWKTLATVSYIQVWNAGFWSCHERIPKWFWFAQEDCPSLLHCPLSQGFSWIFYICCLQWDASPSPAHCSNEDKALWIKSVKCFASITDFTKARLNPLPPHTYVCTVSAQKCSSPRSESADLNGPLHSGLWGNTHLQILSQPQSFLVPVTSWTLCRYYLFSWMNKCTN